MKFFIQKTERKKPDSFVPNAKLFLAILIVIFLFTFTKTTKGAEIYTQLETDGNIYTRTEIPFTPNQFYGILNNTSGTNTTSAYPLRIKFLLRNESTALLPFQITVVTGVNQCDFYIPTSTLNLYMNQWRYYYENLSSGNCQLNSSATSTDYYVLASNQATPNNFSVMANDRVSSTVMNSLGNFVMTLYDTTSTETSEPSNFSPFISLLFPQNGTSTYSFDPWIAYASGLKDHKYNLSIHYYSDQVLNPPTGGTDSVTFNGTDLFENASGTYSGAVAIPRINVPKFHGIDGATSTLFTATLQLFDITTGNNRVAYTTSSYYIILIPSGQTLVPVRIPTITTNSADQNSIILSIASSSNIMTEPVITSSTAYCSPASDWTDVGGGIRYGLCWTSNLLLFSNISSQNFLNTQVIKFESIPPFSIYFDIMNAVSSSVNSYNMATSSGITLTTQDLQGNNITLATLNESQFYNRFNSSTPSSTAKNTVSNLGNYIKATLWILCAIGIIKLIKRA